jgi:hypothetical protein
MYKGENIILKQLFWIVLWRNFGKDKYIDVQYYGVLLTKEFSESFQILETHEMNTMFY